MPPPPGTPSPHRFVIKPPLQPARKTPLTQEYKPRLRPAPPPPSGTAHAHPSSAPQFNATPRFHLPSTPKPKTAPRPSSTQQDVGHTPKTAPRYFTPAVKQEWDLDEDGINSSFSSQEVKLSIEEDESREEGYQSTDQDDGEHEKDEYGIETRSLKRRRLSSSPLPTNPADYRPNVSSSLLLPSSPQRPRPVPLAVSRFKAPLLPTTPHEDASNPLPAFRKPPTFRPPSPPSNSQIKDPLPEQFSPHAKGRKYILGGLAAELQGWLFNIESSVSAASYQSTVNADPWTVKVVVNEVSGSENGGMTMVRGWQIHIQDHDVNMVDNPGEVRIILAGEGQGAGLQRGERIERARVVGVKGPMWEVVIEGLKWGVGVDWKVF